MFHVSLTTPKSFDSRKTYRTRDLSFSVRSCSVLYDTSHSGSYGTIAVSSSQDIASAVAEMGRLCGPG